MTFEPVASSRMASSCAGIEGEAGRRRRRRGSRTEGAPRRPRARPRRPGERGGPRRRRGTSRTTRATNARRRRTHVAAGGAEHALAGTQGGPLSRRGGDRDAVEQLAPRGRRLPRSAGGRVLLGRDDLEQEARIRAIMWTSPSPSSPSRRLAFTGRTRLTGGDAWGLLRAENSSGRGAFARGAVDFASSGRGASMRRSGPRSVGSRSAALTSAMRASTTSEITTASRSRAPVLEPPLERTLGGHGRTLLLPELDPVSIALERLAEPQTRPGRSH